MLVDFTLNGRVVKAVAQPTKQSILYVFDRATGKPIWPIEEKPVPGGDVPGEKYSPTQPIPSKPPAYGRTGTSVDELIDFTPALRAEAEKVAARYKMGPLFTPPVMSKVEGPLATLVAGCCQGGTGWPGGSYDPQTHILYTFTWAEVNPLGIIPPEPGKTDMNFISGIARPAAPTDASGETPRPPLTVQGLPLFKPPYGQIVAINLDKGEIAWKVAHGETPDNVRNSPALQGLSIPRTGRGGLVGVLTTASLVIAGERGTFTDAQGRDAARLRAYDKATGKEVGAVFMPTGQTGSPMTYMMNGKQYIVIAIGGPNFPGELVAYKLPN
jgi:quinoprotein glucose dehydrogenase